MKWEKVFFCYRMNKLTDVLHSFGQPGVAEEGGGTDVLLQVPLAKNSGSSSAAFISKTVPMP